MEALNMKVELKFAMVVNGGLYVYVVGTTTSIHIYLGVLKPW